MAWYSILKDIGSIVFKSFKWVYKPISEFFKNVFKEKTLILGPRGSGKSTLGDILRGDGYFIGEYNHTAELVIIKKNAVGTFNPNGNPDNGLKLKVKHDIPGESFELWEMAIKKDKPKAIILILDLHGLVVDGEICTTGEDEFIDFRYVKDGHTEERVFTNTQKTKYENHVNSLKTIKDAYTNNRNKIDCMMVFLNKVEKWSEGGDIENIIYKYKTMLNNEVNLTILAKTLGMKRDILWVPTSLDETYHDKHLGPALQKLVSRMS